MNPPEEKATLMPAWQATIVRSDLERLPYDEREPFIDALSEAVQAVCEEFGLEF
jgi:hypothetical protein